MPHPAPAAGNEGEGEGDDNGGAGANVGTDTIFIVVAAVVANDVGALFVGSAAGRTPLREWVSPNKSVEGLLGGAVATIVVTGISTFASPTRSSWTRPPRSPAETPAPVRSSARARAGDG